MKSFYKKLGKRISNKLDEKLFKICKNKDRSNSKSFWFSTISITNEKSKLIPISKASPIVRAIFITIPTILPPHASRINRENYLSRFVIELDFEEFGLTKKSYRSKINKEMEELGFLYSIGNNKYLVNPYFFCSLSSKQLEEKGEFEFQLKAFSRHKYMGNHSDASYVLEHYFEDKINVDETDDTDETFEDKISIEQTLKINKTLEDYENF